MGRAARRPGHPATSPHCDGIVAAKYLAAVPYSPLFEGQRLVVTEVIARDVLHDAPGRLIAW